MEGRHSANSMRRIASVIRKQLEDRKQKGPLFWALYSYCNRIAQSQVTQEENVYSASNSTLQFIGISGKSSRELKQLVKRRQKRTHTRCLFAGFYAKLAFLILTLCIGSSSIAAIKHCELQKREFSLAYSSKGLRVHHGRRDLAAGCQHSGTLRKWRDYIFDHNHKEGSVQG